MCIRDREKEGISIKRWENLKGHDKDGFTVIDHRLKVCYTGQSLYEYDYKQGNILDGKGTKLEKGVMSDLMEIHGKPGKLRLNDDGISVFYRKEALVIPDKETRFTSMCRWAWSFLLSVPLCLMIMYW